MDYDDVVKELERRARPEALEGMARYGIGTENALGVRVPDLRKLARRIGTDHAIARKLWASGVHDARILATMVEDPARVTEAQMERWVRRFNSWDLCDQCCMNLFAKTSFAWGKAFEWSERDDEFVKRAAFALMAVLAVHDKDATNSQFATLFPVIEREATDERNYVRKAVNWALRGIGKRNRSLNRGAVAAAKRIAKIDSKAARWIAADALRELTGEGVQARLRK